MHFKNITSDVDPHWIHKLMTADPDPDRIQDNKITQLISNDLLKVKKKRIIFKSVPKPYRLATFLCLDLKTTIS